MLLINVKITPLVEHESVLEESRPDLALGFHKSHLNTLYQRKEYKEAFVGDVTIVPSAAVFSWRLVDFMKKAFLARLKSKAERVVSGAVKLKGEKEPSKEDAADAVTKAQALLKSLTIF